jgi:hypothetical protein
LILDDETNLLGYFSLSFKEFTIPTENAISKSASKKLGAKKLDDGEFSRVRAYLIGQLGKNKAIKNNPLNLTVMLDEVYGIISKARDLIGGRAIILECSPDENLVNLYESQGFQKVEIELTENGDITMFIAAKKN